HRPGWAFGEMLLLFVAIAITFDQFRRVRRPAAYLLIPYMVWVAFALLLNLSLWQLNGGGLASVLGVSG
ncbi:MAG: tryptophan-rich sensory protein, partial [Xanthomonadales bacterium]|nr:tryptophan-rich sensory protein [Xanthomonadales bacterium]